MSVADQHLTQQCHYGPTHTGPFEREHVRPRSRGGTDHPDNIVTACRSCNRSKADRTPIEWLGHPCCDLHGDHDLADAFLSAPPRTHPHQWWKHIDAAMPCSSCDRWGKAKWQDRHGRCPLCQHEPLDATLNR